MTTPTYPICFLDTETTGLHPEALAWEFAGIRVDPDGTTTELHFFIDAPVHDADLRALKIGGYYDRHPDYTPRRPIVTDEANGWNWIDYPPTTPEVLTPEEAARKIERHTREAILAGSNPDYDARILSILIRDHGLLPAWHYRHLDVITFAAGRLARSTKTEHRALVDTLPWKSDQIAAALGVTATPEDRHTALGDARWTQRIYEAAVTR